MVNSMASELKEGMMSYRVADTGGRDLDEHFADLRGIPFNVLDLQGLLEAVVRDASKRIAGRIDDRIRGRSRCK